MSPANNTLHGSSIYFDVFCATLFLLPEKTLERNDSKMKHNKEPLAATLEIPTMHLTCLWQHLCSSGLVLYLFSITQLDITFAPLT